MHDAVIVYAVRTAVAKGKADGALARAGVTPIARYVEAAA